MTTAPTTTLEADSATPDQAGSGGKPNRAGLNTDTLALAGVFIAMFAFLAAIFAVGLAARAIDEHEAVADAIGAQPAPSGGEPVNVTLEEFAITPGSLDVPSGAVLAVANQGQITHNLSVGGAASPMIDGGESTQLDLGSLAPGTYTMRCDVPGHEAAGMTGILTVR